MSRTVRAALLALAMLPGCQALASPEAQSGPAEKADAPSPPGIPAPPDAPAPPDGDVAPGPTIPLTSPAFTGGGPLPREFTCEGKDISPPLQWSRVPDGARSLVLILDHTVPRPANRSPIHGVHWILYDIPPGATSLPRGVTDAQLPEGTRPGKNDWHQTGYHGPCPPGEARTYVFHLYALDTTLPALHMPLEADLQAAMSGHVLARGRLAGTYERQLATASVREE